MAIRISRAALLLILFAGLLSNPPDLSSCGPFIPTAAFTFWRIPEDPPGRFVRGELGIIQPGFPRFYLIIAYRYLAGIGLNAGERSALFGPHPQYESPWSGQEPQAVKQWQTGRARVAGGAAQREITMFKSISGDGYYINYLNCGNDAFLNASRTLEDRIHRLVSRVPRSRTGWRHRIRSSPIAQAVLRFLHRLKAQPRRSCARIEHIRLRRRTSMQATMPSRRKCFARLRTTTVRRGVVWRLTWRRDR
jgi:hypothetical protein